MRPITAVVGSRVGVGVRVADSVGGGGGGGPSRQLIRTIKRPTIVARAVPHRKSNEAWLSYLRFSRIVYYLMDYSYWNFLSKHQQCFSRKMVTLLFVFSLYPHPSSIHSGYSICAHKPITIVWFSLKNVRACEALNMAESLSQKPLFNKHTA